MPPLDSLIADSTRGEDTIVAVSTPPGRGGIAVVRLSGPHAVSIARGFVRLGAELENRRAVLGALIDCDQEKIDQVVVTFFEAPGSYTGEHLIEISCHGSPVVAGFAVERAIEGGARLAEPGEFTLRAFRNAKLDLPQAEAVGDLIEATTLYQARVAMRQLEGELSRRLGPLKKQLTDLIALLEAGIDFAEDDLDVASSSEILSRLKPVSEGVGRLVESYRYGKLVRSGISLAILGKPNVGKSSLFNRLLDQERAIVASQAGTTRDMVSETANLDGLPVKLMDTAGIRAARNSIESAGVERSYQALADADFTLVVVDLSQPLDSADREILERARRAGRFLAVGNKCDLPRLASPDGVTVTVSAKTGEGVAALRKRIRDEAAPRPEQGEEEGFLTNLRQERLLRESREYLDKAERAVAAAVPHEMLLLDLYQALRPIDAVTGRTTVEDILENIFSTFCIGK